MAACATARRTSPQNEARILGLLQDGDVEQLAKLFQHGTDPNLVIRAQLKQSHKSNLHLSLPLLHIAASNNYLYVAECLLDHGADVDGRDKYGTSAVHWAAAAGHLKMLHLLWRRSADMDCADRLGMTPLHIAAHAGRTRAVKVLLRAGADCAAQSNNGELPLDLARKENNANCQRALHKALVERALEAVETVEKVDDIENIDVNVGAEEAEEAEHDRSGTMVVHSAQSPLFVITPATPEMTMITVTPAHDSENDADGDVERELLQAKTAELRAHMSHLRAETARLKRMEEEEERERQYEMELSRQLDRSISMSQRQRERSLKRERSKIRSKSRSKSRSQSRSKSRSRRKSTGKAKAKKAKATKTTEAKALKKAQRLKRQASRRRKQQKSQEAQQAQQTKMSTLSYEEAMAQKAFVRWLECEVALPMYAELFAKQGYDRLEVVKRMDGNALRRMGVKQFRHREVFVREIAKLHTADSLQRFAVKRSSFSRQMSL